MSSGFYIKRLIASGVDRKDAIIEFEPNANVIIGPSNTGKTYIFQCLKYMLGSGDLPKKINEADGYDDCFLELILPDQSANTLRRGLSGGDAHLYETSYLELSNYKKDPELLVYGKKATKGARSLQDYFLDLCNLRQRKVRRNKTPNLDDLKFADLRHLTLIDEKSIIKDASPIFTGQRGEDTKEKSVFRFLLTGKDDSNIVSRPKKNFIDNRKGRLLVLNEMIDDYQKKLTEYKFIGEKTDLEEQAEKQKKAIADKRATLSKLYAQSKEYETTRDSYWASWKEEESRLLTIKELLSRLELLESHYDTDISRLNALRESSAAFSELNIDVCPVCESEFTDQNHECTSEEVVNIQNAAIAEIKKIHTLQLELNETKVELVSESESLKLSISQNKNQHAEFQKLVTEHASEQIKSLVIELDSLNTKHYETNKILDVIEKLDELNKKKESYEDEIAPPDKNASYEELTTMTTTGFCGTVQNLLNEWKYAEKCSVAFSEQTCDLVINGQDRNLSGKGYRALAHSAFTIGLMLECLRSDNNHSGVTLIDSPLCTLRSKHIADDTSSTSNDIINDETKEAFYLSISKLKGEGQIIILDNDGPSAPDNIKIRYTEFSRDRNNGRYGFFPLK